MKRLLLALIVVGMAAYASAGEFVSCNGIQTGDASVGVDPQGTGCDISPILTSSEAIAATIQAVNVSTGLQDSTATSAGTFVLQFRTCPKCQWISYPKPGDTPITNPGGGADAAPARSFKLPPHTYQVRWKPLTLGSGRVTAYVSY